MLNEQRYTPDEADAVHHLWASAPGYSACFALRGLHLHLYMILTATMLMHHLCCRPY